MERAAARVRVTPGDLRAAFIAIGLGGRQRGKPVEALLAWLRPQAEALRWLEPEDLHITITYLGDIEPARASALLAALRPVAAATTCPPLEVSGLGCFPNERRPRVLWAGVSGDVDGIGELKRSIDEVLESLGRGPELRPYRPHITLARASSGKARAQLAELLAGGTGEPHRFDVHDIALFARSETGASRYREIERFPLAVMEAR